MCSCVRASLLLTSVLVGGLAGNDVAAEATGGRGFLNTVRSPAHSRPYVRRTGKHPSMEWGRSLAITGAASAGDCASWALGRVSVADGETGGSLGDRHSVHSGQVTQSVLTCLVLLCVGVLHLRSPSCLHLTELR